MPVTTGSRYFAEAMRAYGVTHVFFVPTIVTPALAEMEGMDITRVTAHSEKAAVYMADGYARASHRPGICGAQTIGAANLAAGLRDPFLGCSPVIALTGGRFPETKHRYVYQEIDDYPLFEPLTKFNAQVDIPERLPDLLRQAFRAATTGCPGPVHLQIAGNFGQAIEGEADLDMVFEPQFSRYPAVRPLADPDQIRRAAGVLAEAERPVIVAGGGVTASSARAEVVQLAEMLGIPVVTSLNAKGTIPENHPLSAGVVGLYSRECANRVVAETDLAFFVGSRTGSQVTNSWRIPPKGTPVIQLDIAPEELGRNYPNTMSLCGDCRSVLRQMLQTLKSRQPNQQWLDRVEELVSQWRSGVDALRNSDATPMRPERICREIEAVLPDDAILVSDTGHSGMWTATHIELQHPEQTYIRAAGSLGWGLPAAIGAKCAQPDRPVVCFTGDGGFYYHMAELETAMRYGINVVIVVNNNNALSQETEIFDEAYGGKQDVSLEMWQFREQNLARIAEAMDCFGERVERPEAIRPALERALAAGRPAVVDIASDIDALAPNGWAQ
ncbi:MAG: thiamine pyrophosphate-binding protein [Planctomycetes bacterium]|nr:thiamine pyrophosphate-binding protein [Planctomycetota bacterium]MBL7044177.1 thiamine pyrophosphate-binding protein [Pirellulaceae bacterium]